MHHVSRSPFPLVTWQRRTLLRQTRAAWGSSSAGAEGRKPPELPCRTANEKTLLSGDSRFHPPFFTVRRAWQSPHGSSRTRTGDEAGMSTGYADVRGDSAVRGLELGSTGLRREDTETRGDRQPSKAAQSLRPGACPPPGRWAGARLTRRSQAWPRPVTVTDLLRLHSLEGHSVAGPRLLPCHKYGLRLVDGTSRTGRACEADG